MKFRYKAIILGIVTGILSLGFWTLAKLSKTVNMGGPPAEPSLLHYTFSHLWYIVIIIYAILLIYFIIKRKKNKVSDNSKEQ